MTDVRWRVAAVGLVLVGGCTCGGPAPGPGEAEPPVRCPSGMLPVVAVEPSREVALRDDFVDVPFDALVVRAETETASLLVLRDGEAIELLRSCDAPCFAFGRFADTGVADPSMVHCADGAAQPK